jgi:hypothetical protein
MAPFITGADNQEAVSGFHQAFGVSFTALEKHPKYLPAICTWNKA